MSNRDARHHIDRFGIATSVCPDCGRMLEFVGIEEVEGVDRRNVCSQKK
jgi:uncharacterized protein with PIN domain